MADRSARSLRPRADTPVLVIGLGRFGAATAGQLDRLGREVLVVDEDETLVQKWGDRVTHAVQADASSLEALQQIGAQNFGVAIVGVGSDVEASVLIVANLVDLGVGEIWAKASSESHGRILTRIGAHHIVRPEREAGERTAHLVSGRMLDFIELDDDFVIVKMWPPQSIQGVSLTASGVRTKFRVTVVGVKAPGSPFTYATNETVVTADDLILVSGTGADIERFAALGG